MTLTEQAYAELRQVFDPEIPVNIIDLGLVYDVKVDGTKCNICTQLSALPSALQASQASSMDLVTNKGRSVAGSTTAHDRKDV